MDRPFVVLAALPAEAAAMLRLIRSKPLMSPPPSSLICHELFVGDGQGETAEAGVLVQLEGTGRVTAAVSTAYAISAWDPGFLLIIGTAGGFHSNGVSLGDIIVATEILDYESQRLGGGPPTIRWATYRPDEMLLRLARRVSALPNMPSETHTERVPNIHFGPILSGDKVVASADALRQFLAFREGVLGVEMEGAGVAFAARQVSKPLLMIRGVADYADESKSSDSERWSTDACDAVARFVHAFLNSWVQERQGHSV